MSSSYTSSARFTLQATGENNNTWGAILNAGVFQLVDDNINGLLSFALSGTKVLTTVLGATDEARLAFLQVVGGSGGVITIPAAPKGYFLLNNSAGPVSVTAGGGTTAVFLPGDAGPLFSDGASSYGLQIGNQTLRSFITNGDQAVINYVNAAIASGNVNLPPATGNEGKALIVRDIGSPPAAAWVPDFIQQTDVVGLAAAQAAQAANVVLARAFYGDLF